MTAPAINTSLWDRYEWVGDEARTGAECARKIAQDLAAEPRHWNEGSLIFDDGAGKRPRELETAGMAAGDAGMTGGGSNPGGGERWAKAD